MRGLVVLTTGVALAIGAAFGLFLFVKKVMSLEKTRQIAGWFKNMIDKAKAWMQSHTQSAAAAG